MKNKTTTKARKGYTITRGIDNGYAHLHLSFVRPSTYEAERPEFAALRLRWQATDRGADCSEWYGFHATLEQDSIEKFTEEARLASALEKLLVGHGASPADYVSQLEKAGFVRYVMDRRQSPDLVRLECVLPADYSRWMPDYNRLSWDSCIVATVARDEETAKRDILARLADRQNHWHGETVAQKVKEYLDAGQPVMRDRNHDAPETGATDDLIRSPKDREAKRAPAREVVAFADMVPVEVAS